MRVLISPHLCQQLILSVFFIFAELLCRWVVSVYFNVCFHDGGDLLYLLVTCIPLQWIAGTCSLHFLVSSLLFFNASFPPCVEICPVGNAAWPLAEVGCTLSVVLRESAFPHFLVRILFVSQSVCNILAFFLFSWIPQRWSERFLEPIFKFP